MTSARDKAIHICPGQLNPHSCGVVADTTTHEYYTGSWTEECSGSLPSWMSTSIEQGFWIPSHLLQVPSWSITHISHGLHRKRMNCIASSITDTASQLLRKQCLFSTTKRCFDTEMAEIFTMEHLNRPTRHMLFVICFENILIQRGMWHLHQLLIL